jgi:hypothetical protein
MRYRVIQNAIYELCRNNVMPPHVISCLFVMDWVSVMKNQTQITNIPWTYDLITGRNTRGLTRDVLLDEFYCSCIHKYPESHIKGGRLGFVLSEYGEYVAKKYPVFRLNDHFKQPPEVMPFEKTLKAYEDVKKETYGWMQFVDSLYPLKFGPHGVIDLHKRAQQYHEEQSKADVD